MFKIVARKLLDFDTEQLWGHLTGDFILVFDDGEEIVTSSRETIYSHYTWVFHKRYPKTPLLKKHHVSDVLKTAKLSSSTHIKLFASVLWDSFRSYPELDPVELVNDLTLLLYQTSSNLYNALLSRIENSVVSLDIVDFINVLENPTIKEVLNNLQPDPKSIANSYSVISYGLKKDPELLLNPLARATRAGLVKEAQVLQCIGPRGYVTDIDSNQFKIPILRGYTKGIRRLYDSLIESRSASQSLYFSKSDLQNAEYFSRKLQLLCQTVKNLHHCDCGSEDYLVWKIKPPVHDEEGRMTFPGDLVYLVGKYYLDHDSNTLKVIRDSDKHLEGKTLKIRSVVAGCSHPDPYGICSTCFGELGLAVPKNTNIGQMCATTLTQKSSQSILGAKHLQVSAVIEKIELNSEDKKYLKISSSGESYLLSDSLKGKSVKIMIPAAQAMGLTDVLEVSDVHKLGTTRVSEIYTFVMIVRTKDEEHRLPLDVNRGKRMASLSYSALEFIKRKGWSVDDKENFIIDMDGWNYNDTLMSLPNRHFNMSDVTQSIARLLESKMADVNNPDENKDPEAVLLDLYELVTKHLSVNLAVLEVTLLPALIISIDNMDFRIPKSYTSRMMGASKQTIRNRSISAAMAYEYHKDTLVDPASYFKTNRPYHQMDVFLKPYETIKYLESLGK